MSKHHIDTTCVQGGYTPGNGEPRQIPIIQSTTFKYDTSEDMGKLFDLEASGYFYTRLQNPTNDYVAAKIAQLEGGTAAMLTSSGQAASFFSVFNLAGQGDHIVASSTIYGGTYNLFAVTMKRMGIDFTFVAPDCSDEELEAAFRPNTKAVFGETIANPALVVFDIERFAKAAHAHSFIRRLPDGYDTVLGEDGGALSQGQKQLLCIARIFLCLPPMLILDEATSSIDTRTELKIQNAFAALMKGRTSFIVAHRLSTVKEADVILVMKDGHIVEQGDHKTLLQNGGFYAELWGSQFEA